MIFLRSSPLLGRAAPVKRSAPFLEGADARQVLPPGGPIVIFVCLRRAPRGGKRRTTRDLSGRNAPRSRSKRQNGDLRFRWSPFRQPGEGLVARGGVEPPTFRFSGGRSYQLSYLARYSSAVLTGLEPATSALTGRRALQLLHRTLRRLATLPPTSSCPQRDSNPCYRLERAAS